MTTTSARSSWPVNEFRFARFSGAPHDLVLLAGVEPHLRYATFAESVLEVARESKCEVVVTVGAVADTIPHTRPPLVVGSTTNRSLLTRAGVVTASLPGHHRSRRRPAGAPRPGRHACHFPTGRRSSLPRQRSASAVVDRPTAAPASRARCSCSHTHDLAAEAARRRLLHDEAVADDEQASAYVAMLEREYDQRSEEAIPSADDLAADFERFLRDQRRDDELAAGIWQPIDGRAKATASISRHTCGMLFKQNPLVRQWAELNAPFASNSNRGPKEGQRWIMDWHGPLVRQCRARRRPRT